MSDEQDLRAAERVLTGRALLARAATALAARDIAPIALKGLVLSALGERLDPPAPPRWMSDIDLLVSPASRSASIAALRGLGLVLVAETSIATTLRDPALGMDVDLHERLVEPELFALDVDALIARALPAEIHFGRSVRMLERHDLYAHLVAHFVRGRSDARDRRHVADLALVARALPMEPLVLARHLERLGLGRAARLALGIASEADDAFARAVLAALEPDPRGDAMARLSRRWLGRFAGNHPLGAPAVHLLNRSAAAGLRSLAAHVVRGGRSRAGRVLQRPSVPP